MNNICACCGYNYHSEKLPRHKDFTGPVCDGCLDAWLSGRVHATRPRWSNPHKDESTGLTEKGFKKLEWVGGYSYNSQSESTERR